MVANMQVFYQWNLTGSIFYSILFANTSWIMFGFSNEENFFQKGSLNAHFQLIKTSDITSLLVGSRAISPPFGSVEGSADDSPWLDIYFVSEDYYDTCNYQSNRKK